MKKFYTAMFAVVFGGGTLGFVTNPFAQQPSQVTEASVYRELLNEANGRVANASVALATAQARIAQLEAELKAKETKETKETKPADKSK